MRRFVIIGLFALGSSWLLVLLPGKSTGQAGLFRFAGSTLRQQTNSRESGSTIGRNGSFREAGSSISYRSRTRESGSTLRQFRFQQEAGSGLKPGEWRFRQRREDPDEPESGSAILPTLGRKKPGDNYNRPRGYDDRRPREDQEPYRTSPSYRGYSEPGGAPDEARMQDASLILIALLIFLFGGFVGFLLFRGGTALSPTGELWSKQVELSCEIVQQMDAILLDTQSQDWDRCRDSVDALRELNGRRMLLLNNDINRAVIVFLASATYCLGQKETADHFADMKTSYHAALDAMRKIANSEAVSAEIHRLLDASHQQMRAIRRKESGAA